MGLAQEHAVRYTARPRSWRLHQTYDAADGAVLYHVYMRRKGRGYFLLRWLYHLATLLRRDVQNPVQIDFQGEWDSVAEAEAYCLEVEREHPGQYAFQICPFAVNRAFPLEPVKWHGAYDPLSGRRERPLQGQRLYKLVDCAVNEAQLTELREWRTGARVSASHRRFEELLEEANARLARVEARLSALEKGGERATGFGGS